ncbi:MAG: hypothetical protein GX096_06455 [Clostridiales bacterium]|nr:hypothetical protein [Clostridiales bacterium]
MRIVIDTEKKYLIVPDNFFTKMEQLNDFRVENGLNEIEPLDYIKSHFEKVVAASDDCLKRKSDVIVRRIPRISNR